MHAIDLRQVCKSLVVANFSRLEPVLVELFFITTLV